MTDIISVYYSRKTGTLIRNYMGDSFTDVFFAKDSIIYKKFLIVMIECYRGQKVMPSFFRVSVNGLLFN